MSDTTAELRGLLRGSLAAAERARVMALDVRRLKAADAIVKAGHALLTAIANLEEDEQITPQPNTARGPAARPAQALRVETAGPADETTTPTHVNESH